MVHGDIGPGPRQGELLLYAVAVFLLVAVERLAEARIASGLRRKDVRRLLTPRTHCSSGAIRARFPDGCR